MAQLLLCLALVVQHSGCGTEVGNGHSGGGGGDIPAKEEGSQDTAAQAPTVEEDIQSSQPADQPVPDAAGAKAPMTEPRGPFDFVLSCATPFSDATLSSPISVRADNADRPDTLYATLTGNQWTFGLNEYTFGYAILSVDGVRTFDASAAIYDAGYTCAERVTAPNLTLDGIEGTYSRVSIRVSREDGAKDIVWYVREGTEPGVLTRIEVIDLSGTVVLRLNVVTN